MRLPYSRVSILLLLCVFVLASCSPNYQNIEYEVPANYEGWFLVVPGVNGAPPLEKNGSWSRCKVNSAGFAATSDNQKFFEHGQERLIRGSEVIPAQPTLKQSSDTELPQKIAFSRIEVLPAEKIQPSYGDLDYGSVAPKEQPEQKTLCQIWFYVGHKLPTSQSLMAPDSFWEWKDGTQDLVPALIRLATAHEAENRYERALLSFQQIVKILNQNGSFATFDLLQCNVELAFCEEVLGNHVEASAYVNKACKLAKNIRLVTGTISHGVGYAPPNYTHLIGGFIQRRAYLPAQDLLLATIDLDRRCQISTCAYAGFLIQLVEYYLSVHDLPRAKALAKKGIAYVETFPEEKNECKIKALKIFLMASRMKPTQAK